MHQGGEDKEVIIIATRDTYAVTLAVTDTVNKIRVETKNGTRYTDPGRLSYAFENRMTNRIEKIEPGKMREIMEGIKNVLGIADTIKEEELKVPEVNIELELERREKEIYKAMYEKLLEKVTGK